MNNIGKGYIHIYTGNGKGKTTAAYGLALRAAGSGLKTYIVQFMKNFPYGEIDSFKRFEDLITVEQFCGDDWVFKKQLPSDEERKEAAKGLERAWQFMNSGDFDLIILDEVCVSIYFQLISKEQVLPFLKNKPEGIELILTGRYCPDEFIQLADLVTEMREVKHYYQNGVTSRKGIES